MKNDRQVSHEASFGQHWLKDTDFFFIQAMSACESTVKRFENIQDMACDQDKHVGRNEFWGQDFFKKKGVLEFFNAKSQK